MSEQDKPHVNETPETTRPKRGRRWLLLGIGIGLVALITAGITALAFNILDRKTEADVAYLSLVELDDTVVDPAIWGQNFPVQYAMYLRTSEMTPTTHGGSEALPHEPSADDPREVVAPSRLEADPRLTVMWDGYPFAVDYREARGHEYMLLDQRTTQRVLQFNQPGACLNCHASTVTVMNELGDGDMMAGFDAMNVMPYDEATALAEHPIACIDCHDPETMALRVTRPAFMEGIAELMASEGIENYDVNADASPQDMRTYVCAQCHVEYYFAGDAKTLTFPWDNGIEIDQILAYYLEDGHRDFTHATTGSEVIKAQHPEFDIWMNGTHGENGVSCTDCHMPYESYGSNKITNHQIQSPLLNINASCGTCHNVPDADLEARVLSIQDEFLHTRDMAMDALMAYITNIEAAIDNPAVSPEALETARDYQSAASFYIDYVYSENSYGFHADSYTQRILADALDFILRGERALAGQDVPTLQELVESWNAPADSTAEAAAEG